MLGCLLCLILPGYTSAQKSITEQIPADPDLVTGKLSNGFTYYIRKNTNPEKRAVMYLVNKVGSILETEEQRGLAHFLEHMAFNGTEHFPKHQLVDYLQRSGVRFGADLNAYTSFDETVYQLPVSTEDKTLFKNALQILRDWAHGITLEGEEIDNERGVILEEKRQRLGAAQRIQDKTLPLLANGSLYAARVPIGTEEVLQHFTYETIRQFYRDWYRPDLQALIIVGDINVAAVEKTVRSMFSGIALPASPRPRLAIDIPLNGKSQFLTITDPEVTAARMDLTIKFPSLQLKTPADFRESLMRALFGSMMNERFNGILQQQDAPFLSARAGIGKLLGNLDAFTGSVSLKPGAMEKGIMAWWTEMERLKKFGFTESELKRAVTNYLASLEQLYRERDKIPSDNYVREYMELFLHGTASPGVAYEYEMHKSLAGALTVNDFGPFVQQYLDGADRDIVIVANDRLRDSLPSQETVAQWLQAAAKAPLTAYTDKKTTRTVLLDQPLAGGAIARDTLLKELGATELTLSNGIRVILKPTTYKKDEIVFNASSPGGLSLVDDADFYSAGIATAFVSASGLADMSLQDLRNLLTGKSVNVLPYINDISEGLAGSASREDLETALQLIYLYFTVPRKDPVVFNNMVDQIRIAYSNAGNSPDRVFSDTLAAVLANYHFRKMSMPPNKLDQLDADKALEVYKDRFADASDFTFTFVGSFDVETVKPLLAKYLGSLPALNRKETVQDLHLDLPGGRIAKKVIRGKEPRAAVVLVFGGPFIYEKTSAIQLQALAGTLNVALTERLREQEGGVYNVSVRPDLRKLPSGQYAIMINFICDPQNVEPLILSVNSEIMRMKLEGPTEDEVVKFREGQKSSLETQMKQNGFWLNYISGRLQRGETLELPDLKKTMGEVTPQSLQQTAARYFNNENYIRVVLVPENR